MAGKETAHRVRMLIRIRRFKNKERGDRHWWRSTRKKDIYIKKGE